MSRWGVIGAGVLAVVTAALAAVSLWPRHPVVGENVFVNPAGIIDAFSTPSLVSDPRRPGHLVAVYRQDRPALSAQLSWSADGGSSWRTTRLPLPPGDHEAFFPDAAFAPDGTLYVVYVNLVGRGNVPGTMFVARSHDDGASLSAPVVVGGSLTFQPRIAVGADGSVHLVWLQVEAPLGARLRGAPTSVVTSRSTDGARSFAPPVPVSAPGNDPTSPVPLMEGADRLLVAYLDLAPVAGPSGTDRSALVVSRSEDSGSTFAPAVVVDPHVVSHQRSSLFDDLAPSLAAGPDHASYLAWGSRRAGDEDVLLSHSSDGGTRWSRPGTVDDDPGHGTAPQYLPTVAVAPDGGVDVVFLDRRNDPANIFSDTYLARSGDGGRHFADVRLSSASFDSRTGPNFGNGLPADLGSHLGLVASTGQVHAAWADSRLGNTTNGRQDIVTAAVRLPGPGLAGGRWWLVVAVAALAGAGVVLAASRRRAR